MMKLPISSLLMVIVLAAPSALPAATIYTTILLSSNEVPPTGTAATGTAIVTLMGDMLTVSESYSGLVTPAAAAHIHCCGPVGMNEPVALPFPGFPAATAGTYNQTFDLTLAATYTGAFITASGGTVAAAEAALIAALNTGQTYVNIHNSVFPGGEIRGQLVATPEPATLGLGVAGLLALALRRRQSHIRS